jgi:hypothetical protein
MHYVKMGKNMVKNWLHIDFNNILLSSFEFLINFLKDVYPINTLFFNNVSFSKEVKEVFYITPMFE